MQKLPEPQSRSMGVTIHPGLTAIPRLLAHQAARAYVKRAQERASNENDDMVSTPKEG